MWNKLNKLSLALFISILLLSANLFAQITSGTYSICASGCDYATWTAFEVDIGATMDGNLTGEGADEETSISSDVIFDTDTATYLLKCTAASGAEHNGGTYGGARITMGSFDSFTIDETTDGDLDNMEISKLAFDITGTSNNAVSTLDGGNSGLITLNRLLVKGDANSNHGIYIHTTVVNSRITNNNVYDITNTDQTGIRFNPAFASRNIDIYNNTVINCYDGINIGAPSSGTWNLKNNLVQASNASGDGYQIVGSWTTAKNISEDSSSPDASYQSKDLHTNSVFLDYDNDDYRLDPAGDTTNLAIVDDGEDLSGTFCCDIIGTTRGDPWDIGAYELVPSASRRILISLFFNQNYLQN